MIFFLHKISIFCKKIQCRLDRLVYEIHWIHFIRKYLEFKYTIQQLVRQSLDTDICGNLRQVCKSINKSPKAKNKIGLFPVSRPTLFFGADPKLFFSTFKRKFKIRVEKWRKKNHQNPLNGSKVTSNHRNSFVTCAGSLFY